MWHIYVQQTRSVKIWRKILNVINTAKKLQTKIKKLKFTIKKYACSASQSLSYSLQRDRAAQGTIN